MYIIIVESLFFALYPPKYIPNFIKIYRVALEIIDQIWKLSSFWTCVKHLNTFARFGFSKNLSLYSKLQYHHSNFPLFYDLKISKMHLFYRSFLVINSEQVGIRPMLHVSVQIEKNPLRLGLLAQEDFKVEY